MTNIGPFKLYTKKPTTVKYGKVYTMEVKLSVLYSKKRIVRVYVPNNLKEGQKYPVIVMADGQNAVDRHTSAYGDWEMDYHQHRLLKEKCPPFIIVGIDCPYNSAHRALEYSFPFMKMDDKEEGCELNKLNLKFESHLLYKYIAEELLPLVREYFPITDDPRYVCAAGSSMGGIFSTSLLCEYPDVFGFGLIFSPGYFLYPKKKVKDYILNGMPKLVDHKMVFYSGNTGFEAKFLQRTIDVYNQFKSNGFDEHHIHLIVDEEADHNEASWSKHFEEAIKFWFGKK